MKLEAPASANYCATVVRVKTIVDLPNADRLKGMPLFGLQAVVGLETQVGELGLLFPTEVQLSEGYCRINNMFRHSEMNTDTTHTGYLEDNRRVRAIKLRGNRSDALFMPLTSVAFAVGITQTFKEGDTFDSINGIEICRKYVRKVKQPGSGKVQLPKVRRVDEKMFPQHFDSTHWGRVDRNIPDDAYLIITQKLHGTSIRVGNVLVQRKLSLLERIARRLGIRVQEREYAYVYGSRKVVKDANDPEQNHFYDSDLWSSEGKKLDGLIPEGYVVYGELIGWTENGAPIQEHYTYDCLPGTRRLYVYRASTVNAQGTVSDLSWDAVKQFCQSTGLLHVPELLRVTAARFTENEMHGALWTHFIDTNFAHGWPGQKIGDVYVPLADNSPCDEGVCIRIESGMIPEIYKLKSPIFLQHETAMLDKDVIDIDADESAVVGVE